MTYTIAQAVPFFVGLDKLPLEKVASVDKALRNISQRFYLPPVALEGRTNTYSLGSIVALRLIYQATLFGLDRVFTEDYARWLQRHPVTGPRVKVAGGETGLPLVDEAIRRVRAGETFAFHVALLTDGQPHIYADWQRNAKFDGLLSDKPEVGRYTAPASTQIAALLALMES